METIKKIILLIIFCVFALGVVSCQPQPKNVDTISAAGHAEMTIMPDVARVYAGISILKPTAAQAQAEADKVVNKILDGLRYKGIAENDIETDTLVLYEERVWDEKEAQTKSVGWRATQTLKIKTKDLTKVGDVVDVAVNNGANQINSIEFYLSTAREDESKAKVLALATQNAKKKAQTIADNVGVKLERVVSASESNYGYVPYQYTMANNMGKDAVQESTTVLPKSVTVSADMTLVYAINQA